MKLRLNRIFSAILLTLAAILLLNSCAFLPAVVLVGAMAEMDESVFEMEISEVTQEYGAGGVTITLPNDFWESEDEDCVFYYVSEYADVFAWRDEIGLEEAPVPLNQYLQMFIDYNDLESEVQIGEDSMVYCIVEDTLYEEDARFYYFVYQGDAAYVMVAIAFFLEDSELVEPYVFEWAKSVQVVK